MLSSFTKISRTKSELVALLWLCTCCHVAVSVLFLLYAVCVIAVGGNIWSKYFCNIDILVTLVIDCQKLTESRLLPRSTVILFEIEVCARTLCYKLHQIRLKLHKELNLTYVGGRRVMGGTYLKIIWKNGSFRNRENLLYKKTADSVLLSLFMRTNREGNNSHAPSTGLSGILLSVRTQYY